MRGTMAGHKSSKTNSTASAVRVAANLPGTVAAIAKFLSHICYNAKPLTLKWKVKVTQHP